MINIDTLPANVQDELHPLRSFYSLWLMYMDPPEHTRLRKLVGQALSPKVVEGMKPWIKDTIEQHLERIDGRDRIDLVKDFAKPLSLTAMANIFNIPPDGYSRIEEWSTELVGFLGMRNVYPDKARATQRALFELTDYLDPIFRERRRNPKNDLVSQLIIAREEDQSLNEQEILAVCTNVLVDGHEPIANSIVNGTLAFLQNPEKGQKFAL